MIKALFTGLAGQRGFTLVEMLVSMTIMTLVATVMATGVYQAFRAVPFQRSGLSSLDETRRMFLPLTRDLQIATATNLTAVPASAVAITSVDPTTGGTQYTCYKIPASSTKLVRINKATSLLCSDGASRTVGRNISDVEFSVSGSVYTVTLTSTTEGNTASAVTSSWTVYKRTSP